MLKRFMVLAWAPLLIGCQTSDRERAEEGESPEIPVFGTLEVPVEVARADSVVAAAVAEGLVPGASFLVAQSGSVVLHTSHGVAQEGVPVDQSTVFDLASVTKVMATTLAAMVLVDDGVLDLDEPVSNHLPEFTGGGREAITPRHLLTHTSGLAQWHPIYYHASNADEAWEFIREHPLQWPVGEGRHYSDLGFMTLGLLVEALSGESLDRFVERRIYDPLGLRATAFGPVSGWSSSPGTGGSFLERVAATSNGNPFERRMVHDDDFGYTIEVDPDSWADWRGGPLKGEVNDGNAHHAFGGVAGHAGLFSTAADLAVVLNAVLEDVLVSPQTSQIFAAETGITGQLLGWQRRDLENPQGEPIGNLTHTGFTGTFVLAAPGGEGLPLDRSLVVVLLTNRQFGVDGAQGYPNLSGLQASVMESLLGPS